VHVQGSQNCIGGVMVSMLASGAVDRGFKLWAGLTKNCKIGICWCSAKHTALNSKGKEWLAQNQNNVSLLSNMSTRGLLFQWASTMKIHFSVLF
jgi:hypothetical protein